MIITEISPGAIVQPMEGETEIWPTLAVARVGTVVADAHGDEWTRHRLWWAGSDGARLTSTQLEARGPLTVRSVHVCEDWIDITKPRQRGRDVHVRVVWVYEGGAPMTITEFLNARLDEDERDARAIANAKYFEGVESDAEEETMRLSDPDRVLAEVAAKRKIIAFHDQWPVLVTTEPKVEFSGGSGVDAYTARMSQQIDWQTTQQYRARFGTEPPTAPMLRALAQVYAGHPDFEEEWLL